MNPQLKGFLLGLAAIISIVVGGAIAWFLTTAGPKKVPVRETAVETDSNTTFLAPEKLANGAVKSVAERWFDGSEMAVEYYLYKDGEKILVKKIEFYNSGKKEKETSYFEKDGARLERIEEWYSGGEKRADYTLTDGKKNGQYIEFWETGFVKQKGLFVNDKQEGLWRMWGANGVRAQTIEFKNGIPHGIIRVWDQFGAPQFEGTYENGKKTGKWTIHLDTGGTRIDDFSDAGSGPKTDPNSGLNKDDAKEKTGE